LKVLLAEFIAVDFDNPIKDNRADSSEHHKPEYRSKRKLIPSL